MPTRSTPPRGRPFELRPILVPATEAGGGIRVVAHVVQVDLVLIGCREDRHGQTTESAVDDAALYLGGRREDRAPDHGERARVRLEARISRHGEVRTDERHAPRAGQGDTVRVPGGLRNRRGFGGSVTSSWVGSVTPKAVSE